MKFKRLKIPSDKATSYLKNDNELSQYWEQLNRDCYGEIIIDSDTLDHIGHVFVWHTKKNKGFIINIVQKCVSFVSGQLIKKLFTLSFFAY
jgi:hypothetical protein